MSLDTGVEVGIEFSIGDRVRLKEINVGGEVVLKSKEGETPVRFGVAWDGEDNPTWHTPDELCLPPERELP